MTSQAKGSKELKNEIRERGAVLQQLIDEEEGLKQRYGAAYRKKNMVWLTLSGGERFMAAHPRLSFLYTVETAAYVQEEKEALNIKKKLAAATAKRTEAADRMRVFIDEELTKFDQGFIARTDILKSLVFFRRNALALIQMLDDYLKTGQPDKLVLNLLSIMNDAAIVVVRIAADYNNKVKAFSAIEGMADLFWELPLDCIPEILTETGDECLTRSKICRLNKRIKALTKEAEHRISGLEEEVRRYRSAYLEAVAKELPDGQSTLTEGVA